MSKKNNNKQNKNNLPFANEIKKAKEEFKLMIDEMSDDEFMAFSLFIMQFTEDFDDEIWVGDEGWEDEAEKFYHNSKNNISDFFTIEDDDSLPF